MSEVNAGDIIMIFPGVLRGYMLPSHTLSSNTRKRKPSPGDWKVIEQRTFRKGKTANRQYVITNRPEPLFMIPLCMLFYLPVEAKTKTVRFWIKKKIQFVGKSEHYIENNMYLYPVLIHAVPLTGGNIRCRIEDGGHPAEAG